MSTARGQSACDAPIALQVERLASARWHGSRATTIIGRDPTLTDALDRLARFAASGGPVLISGETGTGKELFARALYLLGDRHRGPFLSINCAQYHDGQLIASELFGHRRGSFTGAIADHRGMFEEASGGVIFLDEVGELTLTAQAMLLRVLGEGEVVAVGSTKTVHVDVRVVAATSRDLKAMVLEGTFRSDLYYRLRCLHIVVPPVRERGDDWELLAAYYLEELALRRGVAKRFSLEALDMLRSYGWPGNVREIKSVVDTGFHLSDGHLIEPRDFVEQFEVGSGARGPHRVPAGRGTGASDHALRQMLSEEVSFWDAVHTPYLARELTRSDARLVILSGLERSRGSYKQLVRLFNIKSSDYLKFMDFLRHQQLKPGPATDHLLQRADERSPSSPQPLPREEEQNFG